MTGNFLTDSQRFTSGYCVHMDAVWMVFTIQHNKETTMRGNQEAYVLVKVKDGRKFVCAINKLKAPKKNSPAEQGFPKLNLDRDVLWQ